MNFSLRSFLLSFAAASLLFGIIMACICTDIFASRVPVAMAERDDGVYEHGESEIVDSYLYICRDKTGEKLDFAVLVRVDKEGERLLTTVGEGDMLIERDRELYYLSSILSHYGEEELGRLFEALTHCSLPAGHILELREYLPLSIKHETVRYVDFAELLPTHRPEWAGYEIDECRLVTEQSGEIETIDVGATLAAFRN